MATWAELDAARPELIARARDLFQPISPAVLDGHLHAHIVGRSPKLADLRGDGRFALHGWPLPGTLARDASVVSADALR